MLYKLSEALPKEFIFMSTGRDYKTASVGSGWKLVYQLKMFFGEMLWPGTSRFQFWVYALETIIVMALVAMAVVEFMRDTGYHYQPMPEISQPSYGHR